MSEWMKCADSRQRCEFDGQYEVRYGKGDTWLPPQMFTDGIDCRSTTFGTDPIPGVVKECWIRPYTVPVADQPAPVVPLPGTVPQQQPSGFQFPDFGLSPTTLLLIAGGILLLTMGGGGRRR